ncbi:MAG: creatininase family protein [Candidatus Eremiobacteraeota bacterium]|nr:creatininase family protein [Candidatus Eremiobacteraeota bacterium]
MHWKLLTYPQIQALDRSTTVPILPVGAVEAHGPHLPLCTDDLISEAMAESACRQLARHGLQGIILPTWSFNPAGFAREFSGTLSFSPELTARMLQDLAQSLALQGWSLLAVANSHFDPIHLASLKAALQELALAVAFPDLTRGKYARRLTSEFQSGACHAGQYETSIVLTRSPELVHQHDLPPVPHSLVEAIVQGRTTFAESGGPQAYFGTPARASAEEGQQTIEELGLILVESILEQRQTLPTSP